MSPVLFSAVEILLAMQAVFATVTGTVHDSDTGEPLAGAEVALVDFQRSTSTDDRGRYALKAVPPGTQRITVKFVGHAPRTLVALVPSEGTLELDVFLVPEPFPLPALEVRSQGIERQSPTGDGAFPDRTLSIAEVRNDPRLAEPDAFQAFEGGEVVLRPESPSGVHIRGGASDQTQYLLDGIPVFNPYHAGGVFSAWNPDALSSLELTSGLSSGASTSALSGTIEGVTREPGSRVHAQGSVSNSQARVAIDGPLGVAGAGYQVALRSGFPGDISNSGEASYVAGQTADALAKLEGQALGGRLRVLGYGSENEFDAAARVTGTADGAFDDAGRNVFEWECLSIGGEWTGSLESMDLRVLGWSAASKAGSAWLATDGRLDMSSERHDQGLLVAARFEDADGMDQVASTTEAGLRAEGSETSYSVEPAPDGTHDGPFLSIDARTPVVTAYAHHARMIAPRVELDLGASLASFEGSWRPAPSAELRWSLSERITLTGRYSRTHQYAQSLSNSESIARNLFPADLFVGAGASGMPVAVSDLGVAGVEWQSSGSTRIGIQGYARRFDDVVLVAPRSAEPFATDAFAVGSGTSRGASADARWGTGRLAFMMSYGFQETRYAAHEMTYAPDHGASHTFESGMTLSPGARWSIGLGGAAVIGRRATMASGGFEWEAFNLADTGSEFGGSPTSDGGPLGGSELPPYGRIDLGVRKAWEIGVGGRQGEIALFGSFTNLIGRVNVLNYAKNPSTGEIAAIEMRSRSPIVVGLDWRY